jgi:hypothetical protein
MAQGTATHKLSFSSVREAAAAYASGDLSDEDFINAVVSLPVVKQAEIPKRDWWDEWAPRNGPIADVGVAFDERMIPDALHDRAIAAMFKAGHEA